MLSAGADVISNKMEAFVVPFSTVIQGEISYVRFQIL